MIIWQYNEIVKNSLSNRKVNEGDYHNEDGILMCGKCKKHKEFIANVDGMKIDKNGETYKYFKNRKLPVMCDCERKERDGENAILNQAQHELNTNRLRKEGITDGNYLNYTFERDDNSIPNVSKKCRNYASKFKKMYDEHRGLILYGDVGTGKTFYACCIANEVILQGKSVLITNIPTLITKLGFGQDSKNHVIDKLSSASLVVLDDLGIERDTSYAIEKVYEIIDARYRSGKPLIITTNLKYSQLQNTTDLPHKRIYDRILEMCYPIQVIGNNRRKKAHHDNNKIMNDILND